MALGYYSSPYGRSREMVLQLAAEERAQKRTEKAQLLQAGMSLLGTAANLYGTRNQRELDAVKVAEAKREYANKDAFDRSVGEMQLRAEADPAAYGYPSKEAATMAFLSLKSARAGNEKMAMDMVSRWKARDLATDPAKTGPKPGTLPFVVTGTPEYANAQSLMAREGAAADRAFLGYAPSPAQGAAPINVTEPVTQDVYRRPGLLSNSVKPLNDTEQPLSGTPYYRRSNRSALVPNNY